MSKTHNENTRVQVPAILHLCKLGYSYLSDIPEYDHSTNILTSVFIDSLKRLNPGITDLECKQLLEKIIIMLGNDDLGREFYKLLSSDSGRKLIDFETDPTKNKNVWHVTSEFTCKNEETGDEFRPDITIFINGLPLSFIEVKKPNNTEGILAEKDRTNVRQQNKAFRRFMNITQLMIFSNNQEYDNENRVPIQGAFYATPGKSSVFFNVFREAVQGYVENYPYLPVSAETEKQVLFHRNCVEVKALPEYATNCNVNTPTNRIITSMLSKERILFLLHYGIAYVDRKIETEGGAQITRLEKHIMRYQQMFAIMNIRAKIDEGVKSGIIWHTQGSGKTALSYNSVKCLTNNFASHDTTVKFYFIVDRLDLMEQASDEFSMRGLYVRTAQTREELMKDFRKQTVIENDEGKPEIMVVNIQKFEEDKEKVDIISTYNTKFQRVFFIDEAHRGYNPKGSFLANLLEADKDAIKIALTGTPLLKAERSSWKVFGNYIDKYYYDKSIADGYTLKLMREDIETTYKEKIQDILDKLAGNVKVKKSDIDRHKIIEHENYISAILDYVMEDLRKFRVMWQDNTVAAMIVCETNPQARKMFEIFKRKVDKAIRIDHPEIADKNIGTCYDPDAFAGPGRKYLKASLILHDEGDKSERKDYIDNYKKKENIDILIVNKMLLTGFDAPRLKKLYLGRKMDGHDLLQALTRVNRPYKNFKYGYVVDFAGIRENFEQTNNRYLQELNRCDGDDEGNTSEGLGNQILESKEEIIEKMKAVKATMFAFTTDNAEIFRQEIDEIEDKDRLLEIRRNLEAARDLTNQVRSYGDDELKAKFDSLREDMPITTLISEVNHRIQRINQIEGNSHEQDVSGIINLALDEMQFEMKKRGEEELQIVYNDLTERLEKLQREFDINFDHAEPRYVNLAEEFKAYFRKKSIKPQDVQETKAAIGYMDEVMKKIKEINRRNSMLKSKYKDDERFVRLHKRILEENEQRTTPAKKIISDQEYEIASGLSQLKKAIDLLVYNNIRVLDNEDAFNQDVLSAVSVKMVEMAIEANLADRKFIRNQITKEYVGQYHSFQSAY